MLAMPFWMRTRVGQWLATNVPPFARRWRAEMLRASLRDAEEDERVRRVLLQNALNCWAGENFAPDASAPVVGDWISWRNVAERVHLLREEIAGRTLRAPIELRGIGFADGVKR